jgi:hypothetical protein
MTVWKRLWFWVLVVVDRLLGTHLLDREMVRLQHRVETFDSQVSALRQQMGHLNLLLHVVYVQVCVLYLRQRYILRPAAWLCFSPDEGPDEEKILDMLVNRLVKHGLATVRTRVVGERNYAYHLRPDWDAIVNLLSDDQEPCDSVIVAWLEEIRRNDHG